MNNAQKLIEEIEETLKLRRIKCKNPSVMDENRHCSIMTKPIYSSDVIILNRVAEKYNFNMIIGGMPNDYLNISFNAK